MLWGAAGCGEEGLSQNNVPKTSNDLAAVSHELMLQDAEEELEYKACEENIDVDNFGIGLPRRMGWKPVSLEDLESIRPYSLMVPRKRILMGQLTVPFQNDS